MSTVRHPDHANIPQETIDYWAEKGVPVAWDRGEWDSCEKGTAGCSLHHDENHDDCETW